MALTAEQQKILEFAARAMPWWFGSDDRAQEYLGLAATVMGNAKVIADEWFGNTLILTAPGATGSDPDWLAQHAADRGTTRRQNETDDALRERLRTFEDAVTRPALITGIQAILDADSISYDADVYPGIVEMPRDLAYMVTTTADSGTGGELTAPGAGDVQTFTPDTPFAGVPYREPEEAVTHKLVISGAAVGGNDGTFTITGILGDACTYVNASGGASDDATLSWTVDRYDRDGNKLTGWRDSYMSRGDRMGTGPNGLIIILPFGATAATQAAVIEFMRTSSGAGVKTYVERRLIA